MASEHGEGEIAPDQDDQHRDGAHRIDIEAEDDIEKSSAIGSPDGDQNAEDKAEHHGCRAHHERNAQRLQQEGPVRRENMEKCRHATPMKRGPLECRSPS